MTGAGDIEADAELVGRAAAGQSAACRELVQRHLPALVGHAYRMLGDAAEAEDMAQEAFLRLWRQAASWRPQARVGTWLHRVTYNLCIDRLRARRPTEPIEERDHADPADGPMTIQHKTQVAAIVGAAIAGLPERQRSAIALVHYQELSNIEAADIMEVSVDALESLLARGRRSLRERLAPVRGDLIGGYESV